jgi:predicted esterase
MRWLFDPADSLARGGALLTTTNVAVGVVALAASFGCHHRNDVASTNADRAAASSATAPTRAAQSPNQASVRAADWPPAPPGIASDFCIEGVTALDTETCYVLPATPTNELLIYFHGIVPPAKSSKQKTNFETAVKKASERAGVATLMPRGEQGLAPKGQGDWWGWPTSGAQRQQWTKRLLEKVASKRSALEQLVGKPFTRVYVAGSSSGAYFTISLALNGDLRADGFAAISGASAYAGDVRAIPPTPFYIGYGTRDTVGGAAQSLGQKLRSAGWPVLVAAHPLPHGTAEIYLDEAIAFWRQCAGGAR